MSVIKILQAKVLCNPWWVTRPPPPQSVGMPDQAAPRVVHAAPPAILAALAAGKQSWGRGGAAGCL